MSANNICVAVRVRPFNPREKKHRSKCCIDMFPAKSECVIKAPAEHGNKSHKYTFDYVYWSHDDSKESEIVSQRDQQSQRGNYRNAESNREVGHHSNLDVYNNLGKRILENAWKGYNASIFAYGQTGSGKSYSMVGYGEDLGIIPLICNELFERIEEEDPEKYKFKVQVSMIEIYNERVRDLFQKKCPRGGLKVREHPKFGPYVHGVKVFPVKCYKEIDRLMELGSKSRTVAATAMNQTSSRAHTLFSITLTITEIDKQAGKAMDRASKIVLVDLAGSERAKSTGASGDRLKEGCAINQSLSALGNVISKLVERGRASKRKRKGIFIPYRTSTLTWLLRESLGGNARTIMVAALSPASINYEETLSTLKYADRAKQIKNKAVVNEDPNVTIIKALKKELEDLKAKLRMTDTSEMERLKEELQASKDLITRLEKSDDEAEKEKDHFEKGFSDLVGDFESVNKPNIRNLHADKQISGRMIYVINENETKVVGRDKKKSNISLGGVGIKQGHASVINREGKMYLRPGVSPTWSTEGCTYLNGDLLKEERELHHLDRIIFGSRHAYLVNHPLERESMGKEKHQNMEAEIDFMYVQQEYAEKQGLMMMGEDEHEKEMQKKIEEEMKLLQIRKEEEEKKLREQREQIEKQKKKMSAKLKELHQHALEENASQEELERRKREFEETQKLEQEELLRKQRLLESKQRRILEESKRQEEIQRRIYERELRSRQNRRVLEKKLFELIPMVSTANDYANELDRKRMFQTKLVNLVEEEENGTQEFKTDIVIETCNTDTGKKSIWNYEKFESRFFQMEEIYEDFQAQLEKEKGAKLELSDEEDPFWDPDVEVASCVGISMVYLKSLTHMIGMKLWSPIISHRGVVVGQLHCGVIPCTRDGELMLDDVKNYVSDPRSLIGQYFSFKIVVESARLGECCKDSYISCKIHKGVFLGDSTTEKGVVVDEVTKTEVIEKETKFPTFKFSKQYEIEKVERVNLDTLRNSAVKFEFFGKPTDMIREVGKEEKKTQKLTSAISGILDVYKSVKSFAPGGHNTHRKSKQDLSKMVLQKFKLKAGRK